MIHSVWQGPQDSLQSKLPCKARPAIGSEQLLKTLSS